MVYTISCLPPISPVRESRVAPSRDSCFEIWTRRRNEEERMRRLPFALTWLLILSGSAGLVAGDQSQRQHGRITMFVTAPTKDGFVDADKDMLDSVKDLRSRLAK